MQAQWTNGFGVEVTGPIHARFILGFQEYVVTNKPNGDFVTLAVESIGYAQDKPNTTFGFPVENKSQIA